MILPTWNKWNINKGWCFPENNLNLISASRFTLTPEQNFLLKHASPEILNCKNRTFKNSFMLLSFLLQETIQMVSLILLYWILHFRKQDCESKIFLYWKNVTSEQNIQNFQGVLLLIFSRSLRYFSCLSYGKLTQSFLFKTTHLNLIHSSNTWLQWIEQSLRQSDSVLGFQIKVTHTQTWKLSNKKWLATKQASLLIQTFLLQVQLCTNLSQQ